MPSLTGALNGTVVLVQLEVSESSGTFASIAGQVSADRSSEVALIPINNKGAGGVQEFLEGEGLSSFSLSLNAIFNTDVSFVRAQAVHRGKLGVLTRYLFGSGETLEGRMMIPSFSETSQVIRSRCGSTTASSTTEAATVRPSRAFRLLADRIKTAW